MIQLSNVSKKFSETTVVDSIDLHLKKGEVVGFLGPNGAGKTTTLRMITGVLPSTNGTVLIDGIDIQKNPEIKKRIGYLPENNPLYDEMTVEEYLQFWSQIKEIPKISQSNAIADVVSKTHLEEVYFRPISELSKGFRQRVGLAQAILGEPDILILDEPTEGLDPNQRTDLSHLIHNLGKNHTVIISSHVLSEIETIASRMVIIHKGKIVADGKVSELAVGSKQSAVQTLIEVEIKGSGVASVLKKIKGVLKIEEKTKGFFNIQANIDIRQDIFKTAVKHKWILTTLVKKEIGLSDVFSQLTQN